MAAKVGSEELVLALAEAGATTVPKDGNSSETGTPLHFLPCSASLGCVRQLKVLFPNACKESFMDITPLGALISRSFRCASESLLNKTVLTELITEVVVHETEEGRRL